MSQKKTMFLVLERTPLFFLDEDMQNLTDPTVEVEEDFYNSYLEVESQFRVLQEALFHIFLETQLDAQQAVSHRVLDEEDQDEFEEYLLSPVHDPNTLH
jgi:hypothetical protein